MKKVLGEGTFLSGQLLVTCREGKDYFDILPIQGELDEA